MKNTFEIIQNTPYCSNCGESEWKKNKKGKLYCIYCGHHMILTDKQNKEIFKIKMKKLIESRNVL